MSNQAAPERRRDPRTVLILIGINYYPPGSSDKPLRNSNGRKIEVRNLRGAVEDVEGFHKYALNHPELKKAEVFRLTSSAPPRNPKDPEELWPTYKNIVELFNRVTADTVKDDIIHIHYSGHGVRVKTRYPDLKGKDAVDEAIAPMDIQTTGQCLRDVELSILIRRMVNRGAQVSIVCDCCHSGSITRGDDDNDDDEDEDEDDNNDNNDNENARKRYISDIHNLGEFGHVPDTNMSLPQDDERLSKAIGELWKGPGEPSRETWLEAVDYDLFAACHLHKKSSENKVDRKWHGLFTQHLLAALEHAKTPLSHDQLYRKLSAVLREEGRSQIPIFSGNGNRHFLSRTENNRNMPYSLSVIDIKNDRYVKLSEGAIQGVKIGSKYALYPWFATDFSNNSKQPMVIITKVHESTAKAELTESREPDFDIELGSQAVLVQYRLDKLRVRVSSSGLVGKLDVLKKAVDNLWGDVVEFVDETTSDAPAYHIGLNDDQDYQLLDNRDKLIPQFPTSRSSEDFASYLSHLARYHMLRDLQNPIAPRWLKVGYEIQMTNSGAVWETNKLRPGDPVDLRPGEVHLTFRNTSDITLYVTVFDFAPWWSAHQIYPNPRGGEQHTPCEPGQQLPPMKFPLHRSEKWPRDVDYIDTLKLFIVTSEMSFNSVHLRELGENSRADENEEEQQSLQRLLDQLGMPHRCFGPDESERTAPWLTVDITTRTVLPAQGESS